MTRPILLAILGLLVLGGGAFAYWALAPGAAGVDAGLPAFEEQESCESCSLRHQRLQRERNWTD